MTAKEFCLKHSPTLKIERHRVTGFNAQTYYLTRKKANVNWFSEGQSENKAWANAAERLAVEIVLAAYPNTESVLSEKGKYFISSDGISLGEHKLEHRAWINAAENQKVIQKQPIVNAEKND